MTKEKKFTRNRIYNRKSINQDEYWCLAIYKYTQTTISTSFLSNILIIIFWYISFNTFLCLWLCVLYIMLDIIEYFQFYNILYAVSVSQITLLVQQKNNYSTLLHKYVIYKFCFVFFVLTYIFILLNNWINVFG